MKINLARKKLLEGGIISGPSLYYPSPEIAEEAVQHGFDFVWIDWQHGAWSESSINASMAPFVNTDTIPLVRPLGSDPAWIGKVLDLGALGIIIPMVETVEECQSIVNAAKFPPEGRRSATGLRTAYHANHNYFDYTENANDQILTIVMVETPKGVKNVRAMMEVKGVDCVLIGPYDLERAVAGESMDDKPARSFRPSISAEELVQEVLKASNETGVAAGYVTNSPDEAEERAAQGFRMVCPGHDITDLIEAFQRMKRCSERLDHLPK